MNIADFIKQTRAELGYSIRKLSRLSGVSHPYISQIETGKIEKPSPDILKKLAAPLDIPLYELMSMAGYIDDRTVVEEMFLNLSKINIEIEQTEKDIADYESRAKWAKEEDVREKGHTAEEYLIERDELISYLDLMQKRRTELKEKIKQKPKALEEVFLERSEEAVKSENLSLYQERFHVRIEDFLKDERKSFYIDDHKLTHEEIRMLITLYGGKEKNYPSDEQMEKEYEEITSKE